MHLTHPIAPYQGIAPEDCIFVTNDQMIEIGMGALTLFYQQEMYPEAPLHIYMQLDSQPAGRNLLLGALLARAEQLRAQHPQVKGRLYTQIAPENWELASFYTKSGFKMDDSEDLYHFPLPLWPAHPPVSCNYASAALRTPEEVQGFLNRMNQYRITPLDADFLGQCMQMEHFTAIGYYRGGNAVCEALLTGQGETVTLVSLYVRGDYRRQGFAKAILGAAADILRTRGVTQVSTRIFSRNQPQAALMRAAGGKKIRTLSILPGISL